MLKLHFFKAGRPYNKTNGYQHNHWWMNGVAGPMSMQECLRLSAAMGGNVLTYDFPEIDSLEDLLEILNAPKFEEEKNRTLRDMVDPLPEMDDEELAEAMEGNFDEEPEVTADTLLGMGYTEFMKLTNTKARQVADNLDIVLSDHSEMLAELNVAKLDETFNFTQYIGTTTTPINVIKAFILMRVGEMLNPVE